jgi:hypothetical protein
MLPSPLPAGEEKILNHGVEELTVHEHADAVPLMKTERTLGRNPICVEGSAKLGVHTSPS